jgi:AcrR family transcriptional regulator
MSTTRRRRGAPRRDEPSARARLVETAAELFYQEGIRAVGIDAVTARSGASKSSLYRTFASKDELIAAFAESENQLFWQWWDETIERHADAPSRQVRALLEGIGEQITSPQFRGCPFINLANEFPDRQHPGTAIACANKREMRERLRAILSGLRSNSHCSLTAYGHAATLGPDGLKRELIETATVLIDAQIR